jgi:hypothetical protein
VVSPPTSACTSSTRPCLHIINKTTKIISKIIAATEIIAAAIAESTVIAANISGQHITRRRRGGWRWWWRRRRRGWRCAIIAAEVITAAEIICHKYWRRCVISSWCRSTGIAC